MAESEKKTEGKTKKPNAFSAFVKKTTKFLKDCKGEIKKIVWPTKEATVKNTGIVIGMCACVGVFLWVFDFAASTIITTLITTLQ